MEELTTYANWIAMIAGTADGMPMTTLAIATIAWVIGLTTAKNALMTMILITATIIFLRIASNFFSKKSSYAMGMKQVLSLQWLW